MAMEERELEVERIAEADERRKEEAAEMAEAEKREAGWSK
jgi:hypothetical protein